MAWLTDWIYRKSIIIAHTDDGAQTNYQIKLLVGESSGATGEQVDCRSHVLSSFDDLRFTTSDGETLCSYWIESITGSTPNQLATVWVKVSVAAHPDDTTIYMYYGNSGASAASNGADTFIAFDDFEDAGSYRDNWNDTASPATVTRDTAVYAVHNASMKVVDDSASVEGVLRDFNSQNKIRLCFHARPAQNNVTARIGLFDTGGAHGLITLRFDNAGHIAAHNYTSLTTLQNYSADTWYKFEILHDAANHLWSCYIDDVLKADGWDTYSNFTYGITLHRCDFQTAAETGTLYLDGWFVAKWTTNEPAFASVGGENSHQHNTSVYVLRTEIPSRKMWWIKKKEINFVSYAIISRYIYMSKEITAEVLLLYKIIVRKIYEEIWSSALSYVATIYRTFNANSIFETVIILCGILYTSIGTNRIINAYTKLAGSLYSVITIMRTINAKIMMLPIIFHGIGISLYASILDVANFGFLVAYNRLSAAILELKRRFQNYFNDIETLRANLIMLPSQIYRMVNLSSILIAVNILFAIKLINIKTNRIIESSFLMVANIFRNIGMRQIFAVEVLLSTDMVGFIVGYVRKLSAYVLILTDILHDKGKTIKAQILMVAMFMRNIKISAIINAYYIMASSISKIFGDLEKLFAQKVLVSTNIKNVNIFKILQSAEFLYATKLYNVALNRINIVQALVTSRLRRTYHDIEVLIVSNLHMALLVVRGFAKYLQGITEILITKDRLVNWRLTKISSIVLTNIVSRIKKHKGMVWARFREYIHEDYR